MAIDWGTSVETPLAGKGVQVPSANDQTEYAEYMGGFFPSSQFMTEITSRGYDWPEEVGEFNPGMFRPVPTDLSYVPPPNYSPWGYGSLDNPSGYLGPWSAGVAPYLATSKGVVPGLPTTIESYEAPTAPRYSQSRYTYTSPTTKEAYPPKTDLSKEIGKVPSGKPSLPAPAAKPKPKPKPTVQPKPTFTLTKADKAAAAKIAKRRNDLMSALDEVGNYTAADFLPSNEKERKALLNECKAYGLC